MIDELIVKMRNESQLITNELKLKRYLIFNETVSVNIPETFKELCCDNAKERYGMEPRPQIIFTDDTEAINFTFNMLDHANTSLDLYVSQIKESIRALYPSTLFYEDETIQQENLFSFDFRSSSLEGAIYNVMYLLHGTDRVMLGSFNCPFELYEDWKEPVKKIITSITMIQEENT